MPSSLLIDPKGNILFKHSGFDQEYAEKLDEVLAQLISEPEFQNQGPLKSNNSEHIFVVIIHTDLNKTEARVKRLSNGIVRVVANLNFFETIS